ncbi:MAG: hypothetical protein QF637_02125 [Acidimicrobiales bacterium]|jgi:hypothetical protein|nr:hypothetical protein [Acidimicrobiales bacterium]
MSDVSDIARWCSERGHRQVALRTRRPNLSAALQDAGVEIIEEPSDLVLWLDDEICFSAPWNHSSNSGEVLIEGCLPMARGVHAIGVETDRAVILSSNGSEFRRIEFIEGEMVVVNLQPATMAALDESAQQAGFTLIERWVDWSMEPSLHSDPCHLSLFRNLS